MVDISFRYKVALSSILVLMVFVTLSSFSYAFFTTTINGLDNAKVVGVASEAVNMELTGTDNINLSAEKPVDDSTGITKTPYTFTLTNGNTYPVNAYIYLCVDLDSKLGDGVTALDPKYIKYAYLNNGGAFTTDIAKKLSDQTPGTSIDPTQYKASYLLDTITGITNGQTRTGFKLALWISDPSSELNSVVDCSDDGECEATGIMGQTFQAHIVVRTEQAREQPLGTDAGEVVPTTPPVEQAGDAGISNGPEVFDTPTEINGTQPEVSENSTPGIVGLQTVTPGISSTPENSIPNEEQNNSEGMESPSVE